MFDISKTFFYTKMNWFNNTIDGSCASITFYWYVKYLNIEFDSFLEIIHKLDPNVFQHFKPITKVISQYWNFVRSDLVDCPVQELPNAKDCDKYPLPLFQSAHGESDYALISFFGKLIWWVQSGFWIHDWSTSYETKIYENQTIPINQEKISLYYKTFKQYTETVPFITIIIHIEPNGLFDKVQHQTLSVIKNNQVVWYDSNLDQRIMLPKLGILYFEYDSPTSIS
jgi:hypothetical protein